MVSGHFPVERAFHPTLIALVQLVGWKIPGRSDRKIERLQLTLVKAKFRPRESIECINWVDKHKSGIDFKERQTGPQGGNLLVPILAQANSQALSNLPIQASDPKEPNRQALADLPIQAGDPKEPNRQALADLPNQADDPKEPNWKALSNLPQQRCFTPCPLCVDEPASEVTLPSRFRLQAANFPRPLRAPCANPPE